MGILVRFKKRYYFTIFLFLLITCTIFAYFSLNKYSNIFLNFNHLKLELNLDILDKFKLKKVDINGTRNIDLKIIRNLFKKEINNPIFFININKIKNKIEEIELVKKVHIERVYPDKIQIKIEEKIPISIINFNNDFQLFTNDGSKFNINDLSKFQSLPILRGKNVEKKVFEIIDLINNLEFKDEIWSVEYVNQRRYNLWLKKGIKIMLPEKNKKNSIFTLNKLHFNYNIIDGNFIEIDLRSNNNIILQPFLNLNKQIISEK